MSTTLPIQDRTPRMLTMNLSLLSASLLMCVLLAAAVCDARHHRIPNAVVLYGLLLGLALQALAPAGDGLLRGGSLGWAATLGGGLVGLALFMPFHVMRVLGAGDVKLMAMVGVWLGTAALLQAALWTLMAGGVLALGMAVRSSAVRQACIALFRARLMSGLAGVTVGPLAASNVRLPYGVAIAAGSAVEISRQLLV